MPGRSLLALIVSALPAFSQSVEVADVVDAVSGDWNSDGRIDRAVLVTDHFEGTGSLYVYLGGAEPGSFELASVADHLVWSGIMWGTIPGLGFDENGGLLIFSGNEAIGRDRWVQQLTIGWRSNEFVVAGFIDTFWDTLNPENFGSCRIDYLVGETYVENSEGTRTIAHEYPIVALADWSIDQPLPEECPR